MAVPKTFRRYTLEEFIAYLRTYIGRVKFPEVHVHGTWKPTIAMYRSKADPSFYIQAMYRTHTQVNGWSDIAQHATIDPDGYIWDGRPLTVAPASATGFNDSDNDGVHPFMFEMIGNFDKGAEKLEGAQLRTAVGLTRALADLFGSRIVFHREMTSAKTCPGSGIDKAEFVAAVAAFKTEDRTEVDVPMTAEEKKAFSALQATVEAQAKRIDTLECTRKMAVPSWAKAAIDAAVCAKLIDTPDGRSEDFYSFVTIMHRKGLF
ncbi:hypothetical protein EV294_11252 [Paenibacillus sp. BK033]|uniref:peptidoglycan recognition protein family protein n=1 Tax=Paenibacillus sp. BK033 TaxID=2512133 RepID=UPI00104368F3|nr:peptidoglycan recognition family protein [Paenibacillus sp. BK033]TCM89587.1 hypothetical protein EV294_11252 [Paenibacillus sp. BK033]